MLVVRTLYQAGIDAKPQLPAVRGSPLSTLYQLGVAPKTGQPAPCPTVPGWLKVVGVVGAAAGVALAVRHALGDPEPRAIRRIADGLERGGAVVWSDVRGGAQPRTMFGHRPDVHALFPDGTEIIVEVENERSASRTHARHQATAFERYAALSNRRHFEQVVVRRGRGGR